MGKLDNRVAIITGASRGIGKDMAIVFAREGARVVVSARTANEGDSRSPGSIAATVERIRSEGGTAIGVRCDVTRDDEIEGLVAKTLDEFGRVDILINNAAVYTPGNILDVLIRHWDLSYRVNIRGPFVMSRAVLPYMVEHRWGHIINLTGGASVGPGKGPYTTSSVTPGGGHTTAGVSKAALERLTRGMAEELWPHNIAVNAMSPGRGIATEGILFFRGAKLEDMKGSRVDGQIVGDAGASICAREPQSFTGNVISAEEVLQEEGVDLSRYPIVGST